MNTYSNTTPTSPRTRYSYNQETSSPAIYNTTLEPNHLMPNSLYPAPVLHGQAADLRLHQQQPGFTVQDYSPRSIVPRTSPAHNTTPPLLGQQTWDSGAQYYYISPVSSACRGSPRETLLTEDQPKTHSGVPQYQRLHPAGLAAGGVHTPGLNTLHPTNVLDPEALIRMGYHTSRLTQPGAAFQTPEVSAAAAAHLMPLIDSAHGGRASYQATNIVPRSRSREASPNYLLGATPELSTPESVQSASFAPTLLSYLSMPGPMIDPRLVTGELRKSNRYLHSWIDVRNVRSWGDFTLSTILSNTEMKRVLGLVSALPTPVAPNGYGMSNKELLSRTISHMCVRTNFALELAQGKPYMAIRTLGDDSSSYFQANFVSSYQDDEDLTIYGDGRGRVVGVLHPSNVWQSRWKRGSVFEQKRYLNGLANIHQAMRDHSCRYGFIVTEYELVCVRYRTKSSNRKLPYFGSLELSESLPMAAVHQSTPSTTGTGPQLTAALALFYLHMLAKKGGLDGQMHWKLDVGKPEDLTRQTYEKRDSWMPEILKEDERKMKNLRGWTYPKEKLNKKERNLTRLNDAKAQESYYRKIVDRYLRFCAASGSGDDLESAFRSMTIVPPLDLHSISRSSSRATTPTSSTSSLPSTGPVSTPDPPQKADTTAPPQNDLPLLLSSMRKLRESLTATSRSDTFAQSAYLFLLRATLLMRQWESYVPCLMHLLHRIHPITPLGPSELREVVGWRVLDLACREGRVREAGEVRLRWMGVGGGGGRAGRNGGTGRDRNVDAVLRALVRDDWIAWRRVAERVDGYGRALMEFAEERVRVNVLKCVGRAYLRIEKGVLERWTGKTWEELVSEGVGWELEGAKDGGEDWVVVRKIKGKTS
ncbi:hypothetical protein CAC42_2685 [Sphaceloma murrayae]|uniref:Uncharacterized protein n=1 Tax=Sphaceloma murrayae TaxID=2082308 RepID=A0A2K1R0C4_9PEZI|nr:hypothetical protein CAC42_2685 [Sphaceloma murrayae]